MAKTHRRRAARVAKEASAASARAIAGKSRRAAAVLCANPHDWKQLETALDGLLRIEIPSPFTDLDLLCPREAWLVVDLAYVRGNSSVAASQRQGIIRAVDALARLCLSAETLRPWDDLFAALWTRLLTSDMCQDRYQGEYDPQIFEFVKCIKAKGLHVALRWHGRGLSGANVIDPLRRFLETTTGDETRHLPVQIALRFEQCQLTSADLKSLHALLTVSVSDEPTRRPRLCDQTVLAQLSLRGNPLFPNHLEALQTLLEDPLTRRIDSFVLDSTIPQDANLPATYAASFQHTLTAALRIKLMESTDPGVRLSLDECRGLDSGLVEAMENALVQATRPVRGLSLACASFLNYGVVLRFTRFLMTPLPTATRDFELDLSCINDERGQDEVEEALFVRLAEMVTEAIPQIQQQSANITCRLLQTQIFKDPFLQVVDEAASAQATTGVWYDVVSVTHNGFFQLVLPSRDGDVRPARGWVSSTGVASLRRGDVYLVGANCSQLILDSTKHDRSSSNLSGRFLMGMVAAAGENLTRLSLRYHRAIFNALPTYLSWCPQLLELNACEGGASNSYNYHPHWSEVSEDTGATLQALHVANCGLDATSLKSLPLLPRLRFLQLAENPLKGEGLDQVLTRLRVSRTLQYLDVSRSSGLQDATDSAYFAAVRRTVEKAVQDEYVSVDARVAFLSVLPRVEEACALSQCIPFDAIVSMFEMAGTRASRVVVW